MALALLAGGLLGTATAASAAPRVTVIGDSVQASFEFAPQAGRLLGKGLDLRMEARVCRRLVAPSCPYMGSTPETALAVARRLGPGLGDAVVINVGYNDYRSTYEIDAVMSALRAAGVKSVVWVTLRETRSYYGPVNDAIRAAARRSPLIRVADWNALGSGRPWFGTDGLHLNATGALALAGLLRENVLAGLSAAGVQVGGPAAAGRATEIRIGRPATRIAGEGRALWVAGGGRLEALDERTGRPLAPAAPIGAGDLVSSDGRQAWLRVGVPPVIARPALGAPGLTGRVLGQFGREAPLARAGSWLWLAAAGSLEGIEPRTGRRRTIAGLPVATSGVAASPRALWILTAPAGLGGHGTVELRDPATGALARMILLPGTGAPRAIAATDRLAWVVAGDGALLAVRGDGVVRSVRAGVRAIVADSRDQLWALGSDRRTVLRLDPASGRVLARARSARQLSDEPGRMALTRDHLWIAASREGTLVRVPRA